jgi:hypothetical protein
VKALVHEAFQALVHGRSGRITPDENEARSEAVVKQAMIKASVAPPPPLDIVQSHFQLDVRIFVRMF